MNKIKKISKYSLLTIFSLILILSLSFCNSIKNVYDMFSPKLKITTMSNESKTVYFFYMRHVGKPSFYENVIKGIKELKDGKTILFYEDIQGRGQLSKIDSLKFEKIRGALSSASEYAKMFKEEAGWNLKAQNNEEFLGINDSLDFNADITVKELLNQYEKLYGTIILTDDEIAGSKKIVPNPDTKKIDYIILNIRTNLLAKQISASKYNKIIVLYGGAHKKILIEELKNIDKSWAIKSSKTIK